MNDDSELKPLLSVDGFKRMYQCEYKPDPLLRECVEFLRYATPKQMAEYKRDGIFTSETIKNARQILWREEGR